MARMNMPRLKYVSAQFEQHQLVQFDAGGGFSVTLFAPLSCPTGAIFKRILTD